MKDQIIVGVVIAIVIGVHAWLYKWMKFKVDEGVVLKFLCDSNKNTTQKFRSSEAISAHTDIAITRISVVCSKSKKIRRNAKEKESWCLN